MHRVLAQQLGPDWRAKFREFDDSPAAAASIGQVHRAVWKKGRRGIPVAVKVQYPGAGDALLSDLTQLSRLAGLFRVLQPGLDIKPLLAELRARITEDLDYELEATSQRAFADAYRGDDQIHVPEVVAAAPRVLITPHISAQSDFPMEARWTVAVENLRRYAAGGRMLNVVDLERGF